MKMNTSILTRWFPVILIVVLSTIRCLAQQSLPVSDDAALSITPIEVSPKSSATLIRYDSLTYGFVRGLRVVAEPSPISCTFPSKFIRKAMLYVKLKMGAADYTFDSTVFFMNLSVHVIGYDKTKAPIYTANYPCTLRIESWMSAQKIAPEQVFAHNFTDEYSSIDSLALFVDSESDNFPAGSTLRDSARVEFSYTEDWYLSPKNGYAWSGIPYIYAQAATIADSTDAPRVQLSWDLGSNCSDSVPDYQLQLVRLYNIQPDDTLNERIAKAQVDWSQALTLETGNGNRSITLTMAEGSGYYAYRVRPIGNLYPNGVGDERNWGNWTNAPAQMAIVNLPSDTINGGIFFFRQFDEDLNWQYHRQFSESDDGTRIAEEMTYATPLLQKKQHQRYLSSKDAYVTDQTVYDYSGRPALNSLPAPVFSRPGFGYIEQALTYYDMATIPKLYTADNFDTDLKFRSPDPVNVGITDYYSNANSDATVPNADGYAFTRTLYLEDALGRAREIGGAGAVHHIGSTVGGGKARTSRIYYGTAGEYELVRLFGDEAPAANTVQKVFAVDPNNMVHVSYIDNSGRTIATCMARGMDSTILEKLNEPVVLDTTASDIITENAPYGDHGLISSKTIVVPQPTLLHVYYQLHRKEFESACATFCATCDYVVRVKIHHIDDPTKSKVFTQVITAGPCPGTDPPAIDETISLPDPGMYIIERIVETATHDPSTISTADPAGRTYLDEHAATVRTSVATAIDVTLSHVYDHLNHSRLDLLYKYLQDTLLLTEDNGVYHVNIPTGCGTIDIPKTECQSEACRFGKPSFELLLHQMWDQGRSGVTLNDFFFTDGTPTYQGETDGGNGKFDAMIDNMIADGGYDCGYLYNIWSALMKVYPKLATTDGSGDPSKLNHNFDLLDAFLRAAGRHLRGFSDCKFGDCGTSGKKGYLSHPFWYFKYTAGSDATCEQASGYTTYGASWTKDSTMSWSILADCIRSHDRSVPDSLQKYKPTGWGTTSSAPTTAMVAQVEDTCRSLCEQKLPGFRLSVIDAYHHDGKVVEGDRTMPDGSDIPLGHGADVSLAEVECMAWALVDHCQAGCTLTVTTDGSGHVQSIGTTAEQTALKQSMTSAFEAHVPDGLGNCPEGFSLVPATSRGQNRIIVKYMNRQLKKLAEQVASLGTGAGMNYEHDAIASMLSAYGYPCLSPQNLRLSTKRSNGGSLLDEETWTRASADCPPADFEHLFILGNGIDGEFYILGSGADSCTLMYRRICHRGEEPSVYEYEVCTNVCASCSKGICFRWLDPVITDTTEVIRDLTCEEMSSATLRDNIEKQAQDLIQRQVDQLIQSYQTKCAAPSSIQDEFRIDYKLQEYHFTLYYYDRAGNLVKTVPPAGVTLQTWNRSQHPVHTLISGYEYNSLKQGLHSRTPDAGETWSYYDDKGEIRFTSNTKLAGLGSFAYMKYDHLGRMIETGKVTGDPATVPSVKLNDASGYPLTSSGTEKVTTVYTTNSSATLNGQGQRFLQNRISHVYTDDSVHTHYSYDVHGNVAWIEQGLPGLGRTTIAYDYDLISSRPLEVRYNEGFADQYFHRYEYDEDGRLTTVRTSRDQVIWDRDLSNEYFTHGPLKRAEYGEDKVQGLDYVYTIQGWLKGINHTALQYWRTYDPGQDGIGSSPYAVDAFGMILQYYTGDFNRSGSPFNSDGLLKWQQERDNLYDGNIGSWSSHIAAVTPGPGAPPLKDQDLTAYSYRYDELSRLIQEDFLEYDGGMQHYIPAFPAPIYRSWFQYDGNGNIQRLLRNGYVGNLDMDSLEYHYYAGTNRLEWVHDVAPSGPYTDDIKNQSPGRYQYDGIGELSSDNDPSSPMTMNWTARGKIQHAVKNIGTTTQATTYIYDGLGNRVKKEIVSTNNFVIPPTQTTSTTWYVPDAGGHIMAIYERSCSSGSPQLPPPVLPRVKKADDGGSSAMLSEGGETPSCVIRVSSWLIYGGESQSRIATVNPVNIGRGLMTPPNDIYTRIVREKAYELKDHLGDVRVVISDMKTSDPSKGLLRGLPPFAADIRSYANYYGYGMLQPERGYQSNSHRYGYAGEEKNDELTTSTGVNYDFGDRMYDARLARWLSVDPFARKYPGSAPYAYAMDMPIRAKDDGGDSIIFYTTNKSIRAAVEILYATQLGKELLDAYVSSPTNHIYITEADLSFMGASAATLYDACDDSRWKNIVVDNRFDFSNYPHDKDESARDEFVQAPVNGQKLMSDGEGVHTVIFCDPEVNRAGIGADDFFRPDGAVTDRNSLGVYHEIYAHIQNRHGSNSSKIHHNFYYGVDDGEEPSSPIPGTPFYAIGKQIEALSSAIKKSIMERYANANNLKLGDKFEPGSTNASNGVNSGENHATDK